MGAARMGLRVDENLTNYVLQGRFARADGQSRVAFPICAVDFGDLPDSRIGISPE
ncbi:hypothetical protein [Bifidobacterium avesanii]|uniref:hypothetical protein n=1 Tax=Bifidobacterium avesanii TaxID=1798157 RepID=UPI0014790665|nr:hypothetical protein [Bifidobacterium avesanii]